MADRLARISSSPRAVPLLQHGHRDRVEPPLLALVRVVIFMSLVAAPFVAALLAG
ncbi:MULTISPECIES: hypothetical protein [unclassified Bradyrhizobium]|uniref:hypothetical protein n=1 Tax=unclassified Bradyrhizobium TaxID=2631580 RepID=UPI002479A2CA|nr:MULTISPECIES: hypothetical protein [unclassified Bradyrhizobium]WGR68123.1 hypothetical protein MTX24_21995 [Bradyrhizobium sp. ISRA426]WGR80178.1 hypothetical protein MTX21_07110 [Bradyrhizobium sp. ISRA430]WGR83363.1 hypothetical protein MTX25_21675 [Bradyrhizobium sp. ISRA432]